MHRKRLAPACLQGCSSPHLTIPNATHAGPQARTVAHTFRRPLGRAVAAALVVAAAITCGAVYRPAPAAAATIRATNTEKQVLALVNHVRATHGMARLNIVPSLERASRAHSREMLGRQYFSHASYSGASFSSRLIRSGYTTAGYSNWTAGENIAYGWHSSGSPKAIVAAWMRSAPHRAVILTRRFRNAGVGRASGTFKGTAGVVFFTLDCGARSR